MLSPYEQGELVWYWDAFYEVNGIGLIWNIEYVSASSIDYVIWDPNNTVSLGEYKNKYFISVKNYFIAPSEAYDNEKEFIESRVKTT